MPVVEALISRQVDVNRQYDGQKPMDLALQHCGSVVVEYLFSKGADLESFKHYPSHALSVACQPDSVFTQTIVNYLLENACLSQTDIVDKLSQNAKVDTIKQLVAENMVDVHKGIQKVGYLKPIKQSFLSYSITTQRLDMLRLVLDRHVQITDEELYTSCVGRSVQFDSKPFYYEIIRYNAVRTGEIFLDIFYAREANGLHLLAWLFYIGSKISLNLIPHYVLKMRNNPRRNPSGLLDAVNFVSNLKGTCLPCKHLCRIAIRKLLSTNITDDVEQIPLPKALQQYLRIPEVGDEGFIENLFKCDMDVLSF